jgi:ABC-type sugar transport system ATPase subunit
MAAIDLVAVGKDDRRGDEVVRALDGVTTSVRTGEFVSVMGPSGSGKSTLLHLAGGLDVPRAGTVTVDGEDLAAMTDRDLTRFRRPRLGFVFQFFDLLPTLSAWENVALPRLLDGIPLHRSRGRAVELLGGRRHRRRDGPGRRRDLSVRLDGVVHRRATTDMPAPGGGVRGGRRRRRGRRPRVGAGRGAAPDVPRRPRRHGGLPHPLPLHGPAQPAVGGRGRGGRGRGAAGPPGPRVNVIEAIGYE